MRQILWKNKCIDLFRNATLQDKAGNAVRMYEAKSQKKYLEIKLNKAQHNLNLRKIQVVVGLKCVQDMLLVRLLLQRIQIAKDLFLIEIEQG